MNNLYQERKKLLITTSPKSSPVKLDLEKIPAVQEDEREGYLTFLVDNRGK